MNSSLSIFQFESREIRIVLINGEPWFVAKDVCDILEVKNVGDALSRLDLDEKRELSSQEVVGLTDNPSVTRLSIISESGMYALVLSSRKPEAKPFRKWVTSEVLPSIRKTGGYSIKPVKQQLTLPEIADSTQKMTNCINQFENSGDLQLAQLLKSTLGNLILAEQQNLLKPVEVEQYEGAVDVAIRLGFKVPANYEASLGMFVKKCCEHILIGKNKRYSTVSHKQVCANMYPAKNKEVESAVTEYCLKKSFYHRDIDVID